VLADKPDLQFIGAKNVADHQIVGASVFQLIGELGKFAAVPDDDLVRVEQAGNLYGHFFLPLGGRAMRVVSATSAAMAMEIPPRSWILSAMVSTSSDCSP